jgi:hypothetical protein
MAKNLGAAPIPAATHDDQQRQSPPAKGGGTAAKKTRSTGAAARRVRPAHDEMRIWPFILVYSNNWEVGDIGGKSFLLPAFEILRNMPGSNNVRQRKKGQPPDTKLRDGKLVEQGRIILPPTEYQDYAEVEDDEGNKARFYYLHCEEPVEYPSGQVKVRFDERAWNAWRLDLVARGVIPAPTDVHIDIIRSRLEADLTRTTSHSSHEKASYWSQKAQRLQQRLAILDEAFAATVEKAHRPAEVA